MVYLDPSEMREIGYTPPRSIPKWGTILWTLFDIVLLYPFFGANVWVLAVTYEHLSPWAARAFALMQIGVCLAFPIGIYLMWRYDLRRQCKKEQIARIIPLAALFFAAFLELPVACFLEWLDRLILAK